MLDATGCFTGVCDFCLRTSEFEMAHSNTPRVQVVFAEPPDPTRRGMMLSSFHDHVPAITRHSAGRGHILVFSLFPRLAHTGLVLGPQLELQDTSEANSLRKLVLKPVRAAGVSPPVQVNLPYVEPPVLKSSEGDAITLLNWTGRDLPSVKLTVRTSFHITKGLSVTHGKISLRRREISISNT